MNIYEKLDALQQEYKAPKNRFNEHGKFKFRSLESMLTDLKPLLHEKKVLLVFNERLENCADMPHIVAVAKLINLEKTDEFIESEGSAQEAAVQKGMQAAQISGSTSSYARKYALSSLLLVDESSDVDSHDTNQNTVVGKKGEFKASPNKKATEGQLKFISDLFKQTYPEQTKEDMIAWVIDEGYDMTTLTSADASNLIESLKEN